MLGQVARASCLNTSALYLSFHMFCKLSQMTPFCEDVSNTKHVRLMTILRMHKQAADLV